MKVKCVFDMEIESVIALILNSYKHKHIDMKKFKTQFFTAVMLLATTCIAAQTTIETACYTLYPDGYQSTSTTESFGSTLQISNDTLFVAARGEGGRYIKIYEMDSNEPTNAPVLLQTLSQSDYNFFPYFMSKNGNFLVATASTGNQLFLYKKNSSQTYELFCQVAPTEIISNASTPIASVHGSYILMTTQKSGAAILKIDEENSTVTADYVSSNAYTTVLGPNTIEGNVAAYISAGNKLLVIIERDETTKTYTEQTIEFSDGIGNYCGLKIENGIIYLSNTTTKKLHLIQKNSENTWEITHTADAPETENSATFGYTLDVKDGVALVTSNYSSSTSNGSSYLYYLNNNELTIAAEIVSTASTFNMGSFGAYNGQICAISNMNYTYETAGKASGIVYIFDVAEVLQKINTSVAKVALQQCITDGKIYDLNGHEVLNPTHGLYIRNGKLLLLK